MRSRARAAVRNCAIAMAIAAGSVSAAHAQFEPLPPISFSAADLRPLPGADPQQLEIDIAELSSAEGDRPSALTNAAERAARIEAHRPMRPETPLFFAPPNLLARLNSRWGRLLERAQMYPSARDAYAHAIGLGVQSPALWRRLAHMRIRTGELEAAEAAFLAAIDLTQGDRDPTRLARLYSELGELYLLQGTPRAALQSLDLASDFAEPSARDRQLRARARSDLGLPTTRPPSPLLSLFPTPPVPAWKARVDEFAAPLYARTSPRVQEHIERARRQLSAETVLLLVTLFVLCAVLFVALRRSRRSGDLLVSLDYPPELRGLFSVRIANRKGRFKRQLELATEAHPPGRRSSRRERHQVSRETHFTGLQKGEWFVTVEGHLLDTESGERVASPFEERSAFVAARHSERLAFDLQPPGCRVALSVVWGNRAARDATVGVDGSRDSLRYARGGSAHLRLGRGHHRIAVGSSDRVVEAEIEIDGFGSRQLVVDLAGSDAVVFKGCPPAVEPYMHGDVEAAAQALEREGQRACGQAMLARLRREQGNHRKAAEHFEAAGMSLEAAELQASFSNHSRAARLFLAAGKPARAAELFSAAGEWSEAGAAYEQAGDHANAAASYGEAGDHARWAMALDRQGEAFDAARVALQSGDRAHAIQLLQRVARNDPHFIDACRQLADCYEQEGHVDLAVHKLQDALDATPGGEAAPSLRWRLANLHEEAGEVERALSVLDELRLDCPTYPNVATRIEALRKRQSAGGLARGAQSAPDGSSGASMAPTAFLTDQRYDVQDEIGRGGMGVVYRAHDKRLDRIVALKQLPQTLRDHPRAVDLFLREAQSAARLNHPNVVTVYDTDQQDGTFFITMELLEGYPLNAILKKKGVLKVRDALRIGVQVCAGLEYAHAQRIVHRDIKTANLFFTRDRVVKIMDFGLAKMLEEVRRASTIVGGTPYYMAPEQGTGGDIDHRADLYAFGVTLFQLVTGELPFMNGDVTYQHRHIEAPDPRERVPELPADLAELILQLLQKEPDARPSSAAEVGRRMTAILRQS